MEGLLTGSKLLGKLLAPAFAIHGTLLALRGIIGRDLFGLKCNSHPEQAEHSDLSWVSLEFINLQMEIHLLSWLSLSNLLTCFFQKWYCSPQAPNSESPDFCSLWLSVSHLFTKPFG